MALGSSVDCFCWSQQIVNTFSLRFTISTSLTTSNIFVGKGVRKKKRDSFGQVSHCTHSPRPYCCRLRRLGLGPSNYISLQKPMKIKILMTARTQSLSSNVKLQKQQKQLYPMCGTAALGRSIITKDVQRGDEEGTLSACNEIKKGKCKIFHFFLFYCAPSPIVTLISSASCSITHPTRRFPSIHPLIAYAATSVSDGVIWITVTFANWSTKLLILDLIPNPFSVLRLVDN